MNRLAFFVLLLSYSNSIFAECATKDLTDPSYLRSIGKENLIEHFKHPRNQDSVGWCGAFASADSLSFAVGEPVSALDVSINQYANTEARSTNLNQLSGISPNAASNVASTNGYCPESVIPSDQTSSSNLGQYSLSEIMKSFQRISDDYKAKGKPQDYCLNCSSSDYEKVIKPALPNVTAKMMQDVLNKYNGDSLASVRELLYKLCAGKRKKVDLQVKTFTRGSMSSRTVSSVLNEALDNDAMPSIGMKASYISNVAEDHELVVVGRRPGKNGKCQYEIRNSWGRGCGFYNVPDDACDAGRGSIWMDEVQLQKAVDDVLIIANTGNSKKKIVENNTTPRFPTLTEGGEMFSSNFERSVQEDEQPGPVNKPNHNNSFRRFNRTQQNNSNNNSSNNGNSVTNGNGSSETSSTSENSNSTTTNNGYDSNPFTDQSYQSGDFNKTFTNIFESLGNFFKSFWQTLASLFKY